MQGQDTSLAIVSDISKLFAGIYFLVAIAVLLYGVVSVIKKQSLLFEDTVAHTHRRVLPRDAKMFFGQSATAFGWMYIVLGLLMLIPLVWAFFAFN